MGAEEMPAVFIYSEGRDLRGSVELDAHSQPPYTVERDGSVFALQRVSREGLAIYVQRRPSI